MIQNGYSPSPSGTQTQLLLNLKTLVDVLIHMENSITKTVTEKSRVRTHGLGASEHPRRLSKASLESWLQSLDSLEFQWNVPNQVVRLYPSPFWYWPKHS